MAKWDPKKEDTQKTKDAYKTLFVARLQYDVLEEDLKKEFEFYGPVKTVRIMKDKKGKSRGYAFVEFEASKDLKEAYKDADGRKINGRRILVDVERGRTVKDWKPRRLGGGLGATRALGTASAKHSGREPPAAPSSSSSSGSRRDRDMRDTRDRDRGGGDRDRDGGRERKDDRGGGERKERINRERGGDRGDRGDRERDRGDRDKERDSKRERHRSRSPRKDKDRDGKREHHRSRSPRKDKDKRDQSRERDYRR